MITYGQLVIILCKKLMSCPNWNRMLVEADLMCLMIMLNCKASEWRKYLQKMLSIKDWNNDVQNDDISFLLTCSCYLQHLLLCQILFLRLFFTTSRTRQDSCPPDSDRLANGRDVWLLTANVESLLTAHFIIDLFQRYYHHVLSRRTKSKIIVRATQL